MVQNEYLDLAIGLAFVWFLLSLVVSAVNEGLALLFRIRAKQLWLAVGRIFDPTLPQGRRLWDIFIRLPFGKALDLRPTASVQSADTPRRATPAGTESGDGSPLAGTRALLQALYDEMAPGLTDVALAGRKSKVTTLPSAVMSQAFVQLSRRPLPGRVLQFVNDPAQGWNASERDHLRQVLEGFPIDRPLRAADMPPIEGIEAARISHLFEVAAHEPDAATSALLLQANDPLRSRVIGAADAASSAKLQAAQDAFGDALDREMLQLDALYRRQNRKVLAVLSIPVVLFFQANVFKLFTDLRTDSSFRSSLVSAAVDSSGSATFGDAVQRQCAPTTTIPTTTIPTTTIPATTPAGTPTTLALAPPAIAELPTAPAPSTTTTLAPGVPTTTEDPVEGVRRRVACVRNVVDRATGLQLIPTWRHFGDQHRDDPAAHHDPRTWHDVWHYWFTDYGWIGRLLSVVAISLGAQFWFDVLRRLAGLRKNFVEDASSAG